PGGKELLYVAADSRHGSLVYRASVANPTSATPINLPNVLQLAISRDGTKLALSQVVLDADIVRIPLENGVAGKAVPLIASTRLDQNPRYSPDGMRIAFESERSGNREIWAAASDGSGAVQLTSFGGPVAAGPIWSPDGKWIAFTGVEPGNREVY